MNSQPEMNNLADGGEQRYAVQRPRNFGETTKLLAILYAAHRNGEAVVLTSVEGSIYTEAAHKNALAAHDKALKSQLLAAVGEDENGPHAIVDQEVNAEKARLRQAINTVYKENK